MKDIVDRVKLVVTDPHGCWTKLKKTSLKEALTFLVVLLVVSAVLTMLVSGFRMGWGMAMGGLVMVLVGLVISVVFAFIGAWLLNLILGYLGAKGTYETAFKAMAYGSAPGSLLGWIPVLGFVGFVWSLVLQIMGLKTMYHTTYGKAVAAVVICAVIFGVAMYLLAMVFGGSMMTMMYAAGGA